MIERRCSFFVVSSGKPAPRSKRSCRPKTLSVPVPVRSDLRAPWSRMCRTRSRYGCIRRFYRYLGPAVAAPSAERTGGEPMKKLAFCVAVASLLVLGACKQSENTNNTTVTDTAMSTDTSSTSSTMSSTDTSSTTYSSTSGTAMPGTGTGTTDTSLTGTGTTGTTTTGTTSTTTTTKTGT